MASLRKLPPEVVRELRRHVSPKPLPKPGTQHPLDKTADEQQRKSLKYVLGGCIALATTAASFPLLATWWISLNEKEGPLTSSQVRRGAFNNSGSRDVGRDPNWDFEKGRYNKESSGYQAILEAEKRQKKLPGEFLAMPDEKLRKHEEKIKAFAQGQAKNE